MTLPPLPDSIPSQLGPVPVSVVDNPVANSEENCYGAFSRVDRTIKIHSGMHPLTNWQTLWHETLHVWLWDAGASTDDECEEHFCDAVASQMVARMLESAHIAEAAGDA